MKIELMESGIQNIRELAKQYHKAMIYFHIDLDGVTSAIAMKEYLKRYGIETISAHKIQYGSLEYAIQKPTSPDILPVLVDFAHGKAFMKIHTDHHDKQIQYQGVSNQFRHSKSNAETISSVISVSDIFSKEDVRIINMIDSAGYKDEGVNPWDMLRATIKTDPSKSAWENHLNMGMACGKLLLSYKNKPEFLETVVMKSEPSLQSMYSVMLRMIKQHIQNGERGWVSPETIEKNSKAYYDRQSKRKIKKATIDDIKKMKNGESALIGDVIFQIGGGAMTKTGSFDRYTAFRLYPDAKYFIMLWHTIGMMQVSKNPWGEKEDTANVHLGDIVIEDIFKNKYSYLLNKPKYNISLLAIKMAFEEKITPENEENSAGFDAEELNNLFQRDFKDLTEKQQYVVKKWMKFKPSQFVPSGNSRKDEEINKALKYLSYLNIPLPEIILKTSGGHPGITNLSGFAFLDQQQRISGILAKGGNPYVKEEKSDQTEDKPIKKDYKKDDSTSTKILKSIAQDVIKKLNSL